MALTINKTKAKKAAKAQTFGEAEALEYVENAVDLKAKLEKLAALKKQVADAEEALLKYVDTQVAKDQTFEIRAGDYVVKVGAKGQKLVGHNLPEIRKIVGDKTFMRIAQISVEDLRKYLTGDEFALHCEYDYVNKRRVTIEKVDTE